VSSNPPTARVATRDSEATGGRGAGAELVELGGAAAARQDMTARWVAALGRAVASHRRAATAHHVRQGTRRPGC
jgi:hypothetical protein